MDYREVRRDHHLEFSSSEIAIEFRGPAVLPCELFFAQDGEDSVTIKQVMLTADRDINMFRYWFYQPK